MNEQELEENQMLVNLVKVKDEEIMQLKRQMGNNSAMNNSEKSPSRSNNASPLRPRKQGSAGREGSQNRSANNLDNSRLEDQLHAMN